MNKAFLIFAVVVALLVTLCQARNYAIIVAGSDQYYNYRHQSDIFHSLQTLLNKGFKRSDIILMAKGDLADNRSNPFPGQIYNTPDPTGAGFDVFQAAEIDYVGNTVTPKNFLNALIGNSTGVGPVLQTGPTDNILIHFSDHGAPGLIAFPSEELYVADFKKALEYIVAKKKAAKVLVSIEACESGSMCENVIAPGAPIVCMTASDAHQSSWAKFCGAEARINNKSIGSCLADEFAWATVDYVENVGVGQTLYEQYNYLAKEVTQSPVQWFAGDESFKQWGVGEFWSQVGFVEAPKTGLNAVRRQQVQSTQHVNSRDNSLHFLTQRYLDVDQELSFEQRVVAGEELMQELSQRLSADKQFTRIAQKALQSGQSSNGGLLGAANGVSMHTMRSDVAAIDCGKCCQAAFKYISRSSCKFTDYSLKYAKTIHNICTYNGKDNTAALMSILQQECEY